MLACSSFSSLVTEALSVEIDVLPAQFDQKVNCGLFDEVQLAIAGRSSLDTGYTGHATAATSLGRDETSSSPEMSLGRSRSRVARRLALDLLRTSVQA